MRLCTGPGSRSTVNQVGDGCEGGGVGEALHWSRLVVNQVGEHVGVRVEAVGEALHWSRLAVHSKPGGCL